jgi:transcription-repair coupling factor (superfamily II helicase)
VLLTGLLPDISTDPAIETATDSIEAGRSGTIVAPFGIRPPLLAAVASRAATPLVVLTATGRDAESLTNALASWIPGVAMLPAWETLPHERLSPQVDTMARRIVRVDTPPMYAWGSAPAACPAPAWSWPAPTAT